MKIKKGIIALFSRNGGTQIIIRGLDHDDEYKAINFRKSIRAAADDIADSEEEFIKQCNLEIADNRKLVGADDDIKKFLKFREKLYEEEAEIICKTISFESWCALKKDNLPLAIPDVEEALEGLFWLAPDTEKDNANPKISTI